MIAVLIFFCFGAIVGSFLNVCIHRMPLEESVVWPSSHCPHCKKRIPAYDNIPFISYILLGGKCRLCTRKISLRYPLVELLTAL
ncbi:MAG: prepilin peptidase, partial [Candidatus Omnitrophica bacterium]|nr:prepilin peptidase [Candidatus Omnitrophota bacterium]